MNWHCTPRNEPASGSTVIPNKIPSNREETLKKEGKDNINIQAYQILDLATWYFLKNEYRIMGNNFYCGTAWTQIHLEVSKNNIFSCMASAGEKKYQITFTVKNVWDCFVGFFCCCSHSHLKNSWLGYSTNHTECMAADYLFLFCILRNKQARTVHALAFQISQKLDSWF